VSLRCDDCARRGCSAKEAQRARKLPKGSVPLCLSMQEARREVYAASRSGNALSALATWMLLAMPSNFRILIWTHDGSNSYHTRPCRADVGCAWWLLCHPSPKVSSATNQLLRESSRVANLREPHMCVAELTSQVPCRPMTTRRQIPYSIMGSPPRASNNRPSITVGSQ